MASQKPGSTFTQAAARRVVRVVRRVERGDRNIHAPPLRTAWGDEPTFKLGKTTAAWGKGTLANITIYDQGTPPTESAASPPEVLEDCVNKFANVASGKWVMLGFTNEHWYLIAAEC